MSLREKIRHLPISSGVYLMKDRHGSVIYVGKAKNLKNRVSSYFKSSHDHSLKSRALVSDIFDFELIITRNEVEALLLERNLIKHHQPRFNILLRDDKEYPYIRIGLNDTWPRIEKVRKQKSDGAYYIGPFGNAGLLHNMIKAIHRIFPLIRCSEHEFQNATRPCNYFHMKMCLAPCTKVVDQSQYQAMIQHAISILEGKSKIVKEQLEKEMLEASDRLDFEKAAQLRDQLKSLKRLSQKQVAVINTIADADTFGAIIDEDQIFLNVVTLRNHRVIGNENYITANYVDTPASALSSFIMQYYESRIAPALIIVQTDIEDRRDVAKLLSSQSGIEVKIRTPRPKFDEETQLLQLSLENAAHSQKQARELKQRQKVELKILKEELSLERLPVRMECIDISNLQGSAIVASNVCFIDGKPAKSLYRKYDINVVEEKPDDFASIAEVVQRRIQRGIKEDDLPDLLVIDGGKGQLKAALDAARPFQIKTQIVSLAKSRLEKHAIDYEGPIIRSSERVFLPGVDSPLLLREGSSSYRMLTRIRDEAHRFAITFHRKKRLSLSLASSIDAIPGVGPKIKKNLFRHFQSIDAIRNASIDQLTKVDGVYEKLAVTIHSYFKSAD